MKKVVFILGPTAVGKSYFGICLAKKFNGEIISADSVQIYKGLNIGSAKVSEKEQKEVVHYAIDILEPEEQFSVFDFVQYTKDKINEIIKNGKLPIIVGGTGLYVKALIEGYNLGGAERNEQLRQELEKIKDEQGVDALYQMLVDIDSNLALQIDKKNPVRIIRAIEIAKSQGVKEKNSSDIDGLIFALEKDRNEIYKNINSRVEEMLENGLVDEVKALVKRGLGRNHQSMRAIGYKEVLDYLEGIDNYQTMVEKIKQHSRNYAKRQLTFLKNMKTTRIDVSDKDKALKEMSDLVEEWYERT